MDEIIQEEEIQNENTQLVEAKPLINTTRLDKSTTKVVKNLIKENDPDEMKKLTALFNQNQAKKNAVRTLKLNDLKDKINDQLAERLEKRADEFTNKELIEAGNFIQESIDRNNKELATVNEQPAIQVNKQTNIINIGTTTADLNRDSRDRILDAIKAIMGEAKDINIDSMQEVEEVVVEETVEPNEPIVENNSNISYNMLNEEEDNP